MRQGCVCAAAEPGARGQSVDNRALCIATLNPMTHTLILLRHGNSDWNQKNLFTGWVDVRLSDQGVTEAKRAGELLAESGLKPLISYTSVLTRAIQTADLALLGADRAWIPVKRSWRLNERHYGSLQGLDKAETLEKYGE